MIHPYKRMRTGFSLIEMLVVTAIIAALTVAGVLWTRSIQDASARDQMIARQSFEMSELAQQTATYLNTHRGTWAVGTTVPVNATVLRAAGVQSTEWPNASRPDWETPFGDTYQVGARVDATNAMVIRAIVTVQGTPTNARTQRIRVDAANTAELSGLAESIVTKLGTSQQQPAYRVVAGQLNAMQRLSTETVSLSGILTGTQTRTRPAVLMGFPELGAEIPPAPPECINCPQSGTGMFCRVVRSDSSGDGECAADETQMGSWEHCVGIFGTDDRDTVFSTVAGEVLIGRVPFIRASDTRCGGECDRNINAECIANEIRPTASTIGCHWGANNWVSPIIQEFNMYIGYLNTLVDLDLKVSSVGEELPAPDSVIPISSTQHAGDMDAGSHRVMNWTGGTPIPGLAPTIHDIIWTTQVQLNDEVIDRYICGTVGWSTAGSGLHEYDTTVKTLSTRDVLCCK